MKAVLSIVALWLVGCGSASTTPPVTPVAPGAPAGAEPASISMPADGDRYEIRIERDQVVVVAGGDLREVADLHLAVDAPALLAAIDDVGLAPPYRLVLADDAAYGRAVAAFDALAPRSSDARLVAPPVADDPTPATEPRDGSSDAKDWPVLEIGAADLEVRDPHSRLPVVELALTDLAARDATTIREVGAALAASSPFPAGAVLQANPDSSGLVVNRVLRTIARAGIGSVVLAVKTANTPVRHP
jgi:hypothetical protein